MKVKDMQTQGNFELVQTDHEIASIMEFVAKKYRSETFAYLFVESMNGEYQRIYGADRLGDDEKVYKLR